MCCEAKFSEGRNFSLAKCMFLAKTSKLECRLIYNVRKANLQKCNICNFFLYLHSKRNDQGLDVAKD